MKKAFKAIGYLLLALAVVAGCGVSWLALRSPAMRPAPAESIQKTPERLARGEYLAHHVTDCFGCHSEHPQDRYGFPVTPGTLGKGQVIARDRKSFPGTLAAANITPDPETGLGRWTDGEVLRALREGVDRDGKALFPMMPYGVWAELSDEDAKAIVAYLRTIPSVASHLPPTRIKFPVNLFIKFAPRPLHGPVAAPAPSDHLAYGKYLTTIAGCLFCHTPQDDKHRPIPGKEFSGGQVMETTSGQRVVTANITPHPDTYIGQSTREQFIGRVKSFASINAENAPVAPKGRNTLMPWLAYAGMTDADLGAIYDYLKTVPAIANKVNPFPDAEPGTEQKLASSATAPPR